MVTFNGSASVDSMNHITKVSTLLKVVTGDVKNEAAWMQLYQKNVFSVFRIHEDII